MKTEDFKELIDCLVENKDIEAIEYQRDQLIKSINMEPRPIFIEKLEYCLEALVKL